MTKHIEIENNDAVHISSVDENLDGFLYLELYHNDLYLEIGNYQLEFKLVKGEFKLAELRLQRE